MGEHTVKLYTRQNDKTLYQLERDGLDHQSESVCGTSFWGYCSSFYGKLRLVYKRGVQKTSKAGGCACAHLGVRSVWKTV